MLRRRLLKKSSTPSSFMERAGRRSAGLWPGQSRSLFRIHESDLRKNEANVHLFFTV